MRESQRKIRRAKSRAMDQARPKAWMPWSTRKMNTRGVYPDGDGDGDGVAFENRVMASARPKPKAKDCAEIGARSNTRRWSEISNRPNR